MPNHNAVLSLAVVAFSSFAIAADSKDYTVNDMSRPQPQRITPGAPSTDDRVGTAPSDAVVLFNGKDLANWKDEKTGGVPRWRVTEDGALESFKGSGNIVTKEEFGDCQLHVEWQSPNDTKLPGKYRSNSGVFLMNLYEIQVLDTFDHDNYADGQPGSVYGQYAPLVNPMLPNGAWQTYDIIFRRPHFDKDGNLTQPATFTILFNGVLVQDHVASLGPTQHGKLAKYPKDHPDKAPIQLQEHGDKVRFRNIWLRPLPEVADMPKPPTKAAPGAH